MGKMAIHLGYTRPNAFGGTTNGSRCGRLNAASRDGMNTTDDRAKVTCKFCLAWIEGQANGDAIAKGWAWDLDESEWRKSDPEAPDGYRYAATAKEALRLDAIYFPS